MLISNLRHNEGSTKIVIIEHSECNQTLSYRQSLKYFVLLFNNQSLIQ